MSGLTNLAKRLTFMGGNRQIDRMNLDKLKSLKKALLYSYQSATAKLSDGREFRCLINPDKIKNQYDNKYISIPFEDICLNKDKGNGVEEIGLKPGDVFQWKENETDWLVFLQRLEETAYFRAEIRRCKYSVNIDNKEYKCYVARETPNEIDWELQKKKNWNALDYTLQMYITKDESTEKFFHRFAVIKINNTNWEVQSIDAINSDGIIIVFLKEWFQNTIEEEREKEIIETTLLEEIEEGQPGIEGPKEVSPYDIKVYTIKNANLGTWNISSNKAEIIEKDDQSVKIRILSGRSGNFKLSYIRDGLQDISLDIKIKSI